MKELKEKNTEYIDLVTTDPTQTCLLLEDQLQITNYKLIDQDVIRIYDKYFSNRTFKSGDLERNRDRINQ